MQVLHTPWNGSRALCFSPLITCGRVRAGFKGGEVYLQIHLMSQAGKKKKYVPFAVSHSPGLVCKTRTAQ